MHASVCCAPALLPSKPRLAAAPPPQRCIGAARPSARSLRCQSIADTLSDLNMVVTAGLVVYLFWRQQEGAAKQAQLDVMLSKLEGEAEAALLQRRTEQGNGGDDGEAA
ncbi:xylose isomerase [Chlorella sorokiniana]|uniref:Xylose isomerase n=1 Tax=Chlorella sorokiniana TaxID=3076 RepID=A0A2P6TXX3_CHLSO|nr:xylose isomerase [Chlorella sorokiniana]|eukprot:PRW58912.1 xylose isomerase [Chlorella sorokiniana]